MQVDVYMYIFMCISGLCACVCVHACTRLPSGVIPQAQFTMFLNFISLFCFVFKFNLILRFIVCVYVCTHTCVPRCVWRSDDNSAVSRD